MWGLLFVVIGLVVLFGCGLVWLYLVYICGIGGYWFVCVLVIDFVVCIGFWFGCGFLCCFCIVLWL